MNTKSIEQKLLTVLLVSLTLLTACAPVEYADEDAVQSAESFAVPEGMSRIYVFRDDNVVLNTPISVTVDGELIGVTGNSTYVVTTRKPGSHTVVAKGENTAELVVDTAAGDLVFIEIGVGLGVFTNRARLYQVEPQTGRAAVMGTRLVQ